MSELKFAPAGPVLDALGVELGLADGQQVIECLVIAKVVDFNADDDGVPALALGPSKGLDWIGKFGLLTAAMHAMQSGGFACDDED